MHCPKCSKQMFFFLFISVCIVTAAVFQFFIMDGLKDCTADFTTAPMVAGASLLSSFVFNFIWLYFKTHTIVRRVAITLWVVVTTTGVAAAGGTYGQSAFYGNCTTDITSVQNSWIQFVSVVLLIISIALPHGMSKEKLSMESVDEEEITEETTMISKNNTLNFL